jgi:hypothetical protein
MNKFLSTVALSALLSTGAVAGDVYGSVGAALTTVSGFDSGVSIVGTAGLKLDQITPNFAVEAEVSQTVVDPSVSGYSTDWDMSILGVGVYAVYNFPIPNTPITVKPRLGLNYQSWSFDSVGWAADASDTSLSYGVGVTYPLSGGLTAYVDFTDKGDSNNIGAGVGMTF